MGAEEALACGLINRIIEGDAVEGGMAFAREITGYSLPVLRYARDAVMRADQTSLSEGLAIERDLNTLAFEGEDATEGATAFIEKRKPEFKDR
jgi:enoyl-CoA hydratase